MIEASRQASESASQRTSTHYGWFFGIIAVFVVAVGLYLFPPLFVLGGVVGIAVALVILRWPLVGVLLIAATLPLERIGAYEFQGFTVRLSQILLMVTSVSAGIRAMVTSSSKRMRISLGSILILFIAAGVLSLFTSPNLQRSILLLLFTAFTMLLVWVVPRLVTTHKALRLVVLTVLVAALIVSIFGMLQFFGDMIGLPTTITGLRDLYTKDVLGFPRIQSTAYEPLYFANYLFFPLLIGLAVLLSRARTLSPLMLIALLVIGGSSFVLTVSRGAYLGLAVALIVLSLFYFKRVFTIRNIILIPVVVLVVWWIVVKTLGFGGDLFTFDKFREHVVGVFFGASYNERIETFDTAIQAWREHPVLGIGVGGFGPYASHHPMIPPRDGWKIVNNQYLELLAEVGSIGLGLFLLFISTLAIRSVSAIRTTKDEFLRAVMVGSLAAWAGVLVQYLTFSPLYIVHIWFFVGLILATQRIIFSEKQS